jgi:hypothetical protein
MAYQKFWNSDTISHTLNVPSSGDLWIDTSKDEEWDCYNNAARARMSNTTAMYWNNLSNEERVERLENHGMTGKKHSRETRKKMSKSAIKTKPKLHKGGTIITPNGKKVKFSCLSHFCKEHNLSSGHVSELMSGKRNSVKGWTRG